MIPYSPIRESRAFVDNEEHLRQAFWQQNSSSLLDEAEWSGTPIKKQQQHHQHNQQQQYHQNQNQQQYVGGASASYLSGGGNSGLLSVRSSSKASLDSSMGGGGGSKGGGGRSRASTALAREKSTESASSEEARVIQAAAIRQKRNEKAMHEHEAMKRHQKKQIERDQAKKEARFSALMESVDSAQDVLTELEKDLNLVMETKRTKTRRQFEDWNVNVHGEIVSRIAKQVDALSPRALNQQKRDDYDKFLEITNRKPAIFRDIIIESEYDPLEVNRRTIKARVPLLNDITQIDKLKADREGGMLEGPNASKAKATLGKETLDVRLWAEGKIQATPFGFSEKFVDKYDDEGNQIAPKASSRTNKTSMSSVSFDHFSYPVGEAGRLAAKAEMPLGKATFYKKIYADPSFPYDVPRDVLDELAEIGKRY